MTVSDRLSENCQLKEGNSNHPPTILLPCAIQTYLYLCGR